MPRNSLSSLTLSISGAVAYGAACDAAHAVTTHLFGIAPNNSGSTFLMRALATCRAIWNLPDEGQKMPGFAGPSSSRPLGPGEPRPAKLWAADRRWLDQFADSDAYDWPRTRKAWYFQAYARDPEASVFYTKSPPHLVIVDELARHFRNAKFLFMVRDPYAVCGEIIRYYRNDRPHKYATLMARFPDRTLPELAAAHVATCLARQRRNVEAHEDRGAFFTYERMCADPEHVAHDIRALIPEIDDLDLRQRLPVKGRYHEMLTDMNARQIARQIARLDAAELAACTRVFRQHRDVLDYFGYELVPVGGSSPPTPKGTPIESATSAGTQPIPTEPVWPLPRPRPRRRHALSEAEIRAAFRRHRFRHYAWEFEGGLSFPAQRDESGPKGNIQERPLNRFRHMMPWLLKAVGGGGVVGQTRSRHSLQLRFLVVSVRFARRPGGGGFRCTPRGRRAGFPRPGDHRHIERPVPGPRFLGNGARRSGRHLRHRAEPRHPLPSSGSAPSSGTDTSDGSGAVAHSSRHRLCPVNRIDS